MPKRCWSEVSTQPSLVLSEDSLKTKSSGRIKIGAQEVSIIMFADDLVLLADSSEGLQQSLSVLQEYCRVWQLTISTEKMKL